MTVLFLARLFYPHIGGVEKHVFEISKILIKKEYKVIVVTEQYEQKLKTYQKYEGISIYRIPIRTSQRLKKFAIWKWLWEHRELITSADIIHCHDVFYWYLPFRFLYPSKKVFTTFHGYEDYPIPKKAIILRKISEKLSFENICVGRFMTKWYGTKPNFVTYGGVHVPKIHKKWKNKNSAVFIGRLDDQTGILTYLEAVKLIRKKIPDFEFIVIGDGKYRSVVKRYCKVITNEPHPQKYLGQAHFAFVSRYLSILEAMACKRLVFAVYDNPLKEDYLTMVPYAKYIVLAESYNRLAKKVLYYINDAKEKEKKVELAYQWVKKQAWDEVVRLYARPWNR